MKYAELYARLEAAGKEPGRYVFWYVEGQVSDASYTIVPLDDDTYTLYRPSGRGEYYQEIDDNENPLVFASEEEVCQYVWDNPDN